MRALDLLGVPFAWAVYVRGQMPGVCTPLIVSDFSVTPLGVPMTQGNRARAIKVFEICSLREHHFLPTVHRKYTGRKKRIMSHTK